jgi:hypothetical protein
VRYGIVTLRIHSSGGKSKCLWTHQLTAVPRQANPWTWGDGQEQAPAPPQAAPVMVWTCVVCRRENAAALEACAVCFTRKDYKTNKLHNITGQRPSTSQGSREGASPSPPQQPPPQGRAAPKTRRSGEAWQRTVVTLPSTPGWSCENLLL